MTGERRPPYHGRIRRLIFIYLFRDFDKGTLDAGIEFTTIANVDHGNVLCKSTTANVRGVRRDSFVVNRKSRHILNLPGRYIVYWVNGKTKLEKIYNRVYSSRDGRTYVHFSLQARSRISYDHEGLEETAENMVLHPRRYHEKFVRLMKF